MVTVTYEEYCKKSQSPGWVFEVIVPERIRNIRYIHPLKQKEVVKIVNMVCQMGGVESIRVFGSSITDGCYFNSDLDICIDWSFDCYDSEGVIVPQAAVILNRISSITKGNVDVVHYKYLKGTVVEQAAMNGVVIYEKGDNNVCGNKTK